VRPIPQAPGERYSARASPGRVAGDAGPPGWSPPGPATPLGGENSAIRCGSSYGPSGPSGSSSSPSGSRPRVSSTSGGSPRNVPIGTPPFSSGGDSNSRREERVTSHPQAAPAVTSDCLPATPNSGARDLESMVSSGATSTKTGVTGRQSPRHEGTCTIDLRERQDRPGRNHERASSDDRRELATDEFGRPHGVPRRKRPPERAARQGVKEQPARRSEGRAGAPKRLCGAHEGGGG
jgi:hypothetical protein